MRRSVIAAITQRRRWEAIALALTVSGVFAAFACGGTNGHEGLPSAAQPGAADGSLAGNDGTVPDGSSGGALAPEASTDSGIDATTFDVAIMYADRVLPDIAPATMQTGEGGASYPWPDCPPFVPVHNGRPIGYALQTDQVPALYDDAGNPVLDDAGRVVLFPDGSPCASYGWLGSVAIDQCTTNSLGSEAYAILPPCNWCADAGNALAGSRAGDPRYNICLDLYACIRRTGCGLSADTFHLEACLCGDSGVNCTGGGACTAEELASLEFASDPMSVHQAALHLEDLDPSLPGHCGSFLNHVFRLGLGATGTTSPGGCFPPDAGPF